MNVFVGLRQLILDSMIRFGYITPLIKIFFTKPLMVAKRGKKEQYPFKTRIIQTKLSH